MIQSTRLERKTAYANMLKIARYLAHKALNSVIDYDSLDIKKISRIGC